MARDLTERFPTVLVEAECAVCDGREFRPAYTGKKRLERRLYPGAPRFPRGLKGRFPLIYQKCRSCGAGRINPTPRREWVDYAPPDDAYAAGNDRASWMEDPAYIQDKRSSVSAHYEDLQLERFRSSRSAVLDVSCGSGVGLELLRDEFGWQRCVGVECDPQAVRAARNKRGLEVHQGLIYRAALPESAFDLAIMDNALEHHWSPAEALAKISTALRPGGAVFVIVPNFHGYAVELFGTEYWNLNWGHWHYFTVQSLARLADRCELVVQRVYSSMCEPIVQDKLGGVPERINVDLTGEEIRELPPMEKVFRGEFISMLLTLSDPT